MNTKLSNKMVALLFATAIVLIIILAKI